MKIVIYTDIAEFVAEQPITHSRGEKGYPYAVVATIEGRREIKATNLGQMFNKVKTAVVENARSRYGGTVV